MEELFQGHRRAKIQTLIILILKPLVFHYEILFWVTERMPVLKLSDEMGHHTSAFWNNLPIYASMKLPPPCLPITYVSHPFISIFWLVHTADIQSVWLVGGRGNT